MNLFGRMFGAVSNTHWDSTNRAASCSRAGCGNTGRGIYQKNTTMDDFAHTNNYGNSNACVFDGDICRNYDSQKIAHFPI